MTTINVPSSHQRADYERFDKLVNQGMPAANRFIIQPQTLIVEAELKNDRSQYILSLYENKGADRPLENRLNRNDLFMCTGFRLGVAKQDANANPKEYANYPTFTYPEYNYFVGNNTNIATANTEGRSLQVLWNGLLSLRTNNVDRIKDFSTTNLLFRPESAYSEASSIPEFPQQGVANADQGYFYLQPQPILDGQQDNDIIITLGDGDYDRIAGGFDADGTTANNETNVLKFFIRGWVAVNAAQKQGKWLDYL